MYFLKDNPVFQNLDQICKLAGSRVFGKVLQEVSKNPMKSQESNMLVDPLNLTAVQNLISKESKDKYFRYWKYYVKDQEISRLKPPTKDSLFQFLKKGWEGEKKYAASTLWTIFSCINKLLQHLYDLDLSVSLFFIKFLVLGKIFNDSLF